MKYINSKENIMKTLNNNANQNTVTGSAVKPKETVYAFVDGSGLNPGLGLAGASSVCGWAAMFVHGAKVLATIGGQLKGDSGKAECKAFEEALRKWNPSLYNLVIVTDYQDHLGTLEFIAKGKSQYKGENHKEVRKILSEKGVQLHPKTSQKSGKVVSSCGGLTVIWVKAHTGDNVDPKTLAFLQQGNRAIDQVTGEYKKGIRK